MPQRLTPDWLNFSLGLRSNADAEAVIQGWVQEMWGYTIAAAKHGVKHTAVKDFQMEMGSLGHNPGLEALAPRYIFHYTYGFEYMANGLPAPRNEVGFWSLDKRHYGQSYPPRHLEAPPEGASPYAKLLLGFWNEAMGNSSTWPEAPYSLGCVGWLRTCTDDATVRAHPVASRLVHTNWTWAGIRGLRFLEPCEGKTPWGTAKWGPMTTRTKACDDECVRTMIFLDFNGAMHNLRIAEDLQSFTSVRMGDGEVVHGARVG